MVASRYAVNLPLFSNKLVQEHPVKAETYYNSGII